MALRARIAAFTMAGCFWWPAHTALAQVATAPRQITLENGAVAEVEAGELLVPESRAKDNGRRISIPFYRLRSESATPAAPIFLLAGGPGSSWLDQFRNDENHREVAFYRTIADVVLFDQRGGGHSLPAMHCDEGEPLSPGRGFAPEVVGAAMRRALTACRDKWQREGVDLAAYNAVENAADVNDLRLALGYRKVTLIGGSYGSHLVLQYMRQYPEAVERSVIYGVEGPDHTWDNPSGMLATLQRIARRAEQAPEFAGRVPDGGLLKTLERVLARLEAAPQTVAVTRGKDTTAVVVDSNVVRLMARFQAGRRSAPEIWPELILAMNRGDFSIPARRALENRRLQLPDPMHFSMDCSSGISAARREAIQRDPAAALIGNINFEYEALCDLWPAADLGPAFHDNVVSDIPTLIVQGTWDMSTPIENAREVAASLRHSTLVEVIEGTHGSLYNLYEHWPPMHGLMREFLAGRPAEFPRTVALPAVTFEPARTR